MAFEWQEPEDIGGTPIIDYEVYWDAGSQGSNFEMLQTSTLGMNVYYLQSGIVPGNYYQFKVRALNYIGLSPYSKFIRIIAASLPQKPINLARVGSTVESVTFSWSKNTDDGGTTIRDYIVYWDAGDSLLAEDDFVEADHTAYLTTQHTEFDLTMGQYYRFYVIARNDAGMSEKSSIITLLAADVLSEPLNLQTTFQDESTITQTWQAPIGDVGSAPQQYIIE
jgi:hypothetical protein